MYFRPSLKFPMLAPLSWVFDLSAVMHLLSSMDVSKLLMVLSNNSRGGGASEQLGGWGEHAKHTPLGGSGGMLPQENFEFALSEIECGAIWRHLKPSTQIVKLSNLLALEQRTRSRVRTRIRIFFAIEFPIAPPFPPAPLPLNSTTHELALNYECQSL